MDRMWPEDKVQRDPAQARVRKANAASPQDDTWVRPRPRENQDETRPRAPAQKLAKPAPSRRLGEGSVLRGRYVLVSLMGQGAMGQVFRAKDLLAEQAHYKDPFVAIKVLNSNFENHPQAFMAMHREASRAQHLAHPHIVTVHNFDLDERSGRAFIAMELLAGEPLDQVIRAAHGHGVPTKKAWFIIKAAADGLAYAHRKGIVHSDLKPGNIFLTREGVPKLLDFGNARAARQREDEIGAFTEDDDVLSGYTATYAAPEVLADEPPHTADDVFSLGIVAYELLAGRHPLRRLPADCAKRTGLRPQPIKGLKRREWMVIEKALAFERENRWQDADAFIKALQDVTQRQKRLAAAMMVLAVSAGVLWVQSDLAGFRALTYQAIAHAVQWLRGG